MAQPQPAARAPASYPTPPRSWRGLATNARQRAAITIATIAASIPFLYLLVTSMWTLSQQTSTWSTSFPSEGELQWVTWQYHLTATTLEWGYPPLLVGILLFAAVLLIEVNQAITAPIARARGRYTATRWSSPEQRRRVTAELRSAGYSGLAGSASRTRLMIGGLLAVMAAGYSLVAPIQEGFTRGYGPTVCMVGGVVAFLAVLLATPWTHWPHAVLLGDGTLTLDGVEPLAQAALPGATPMTPASPLTGALPPPPAPSATAPPPPPPPPPPMAEAS